MRDLAIHGDDLIVATHGRSFWILDDLTPLRQINDQIAKSPAYLFQPQEALRWRWNRNPDTPLPPETPAGKNPPDGAIIDYYLAASSEQSGHAGNSGLHRRNRSPLLEHGLTLGHGQNCRRASDPDVLGTALANSFRRAGHAPLRLGPARRIAEIAQQGISHLRDCARHRRCFPWVLGPCPGTTPSS